jgi:hypothetical protein
MSSNPLRAMCIFLILARSRLYGEMEMRMSFAGRGNENDRYRMVVEYGNRLCARRESERQNTEWGRTGNDRILLQP